jgi:hypothetical protein
MKKQEPAIEYVKMSPVIRECEQSGIEYFILHTGQGNKATLVLQTGLTGSTRSIHLKGREERKAQLHKSLNSEEIIRSGTRMTQIGRIFTDHHIRAHPCNPCSIINKLQRYISYQWLFYPVIEQGVAQWT